MTNYQQLSDDRAVVEQAARRLRDQAIADGYDGDDYREMAFALALVLDQLGRHLRDLDATLPCHPRQVLWVLPQRSRAGFVALKALARLTRRPLPGWYDTYASRAVD